MIRFIEFIIRYCEFGGRKAKYINKAKRTQEETQNETKKEPLRLRTIIVPRV